MSNSRLYAIWQKQLKQLIPDDCSTRLQNLLLMIVGMYQAQSVHLNLIARKIPIAVQKLRIMPYDKCKKPYPIPLLFQPQFSLIPFNELLSSQRAYLHKLFGTR